LFLPLRVRSAKRFEQIALPAVAFHPERSRLSYAVAFRSEELKGSAAAHRRKTHPEMACVQARYRSRWRLSLPQLFQQNAALVAGTACLKIDCSCADHRPIGGRAIGSGRHGFCGSTLMKTFFKVVIWMAVAVAGLTVWNVAPDLRPLVSSILAAAFVCYVLSAIVEVTVKRVISEEQLELRSRLEVLDRKVTAILREAFERRRLHDDLKP
jgi:hypothetical protein